MYAKMISKARRLPSPLTVSLCSVISGHLDDVC